MILYFSASGNSRYIARTAAECLKDKTICLNDRIKNRDYSAIHSERPWIIVCPVFAWRIPRIVEEYLKKTRLTGSSRIYLLVTTCGSSGNTGEYAKKLFQSVHKKWMGWYTFHMPGSYVAFMENPDLDRAAEMNRRAAKQLETLIPLIKNGQKPGEI